MLLLKPLVLAAAMTAVAAPAMAACETFASYKGVALKRFEGSRSYVYRTARMAIDADGAPNAYHPDDKGIDALANAGYPNGSWKSILVVDPDKPSKPYVQPDGEFKGYYVSMTTVQDGARKSTDPKRYVDSRHVPYVVFPGNFYKMAGTGHRGVIGMARNLKTGETSPIIYADAGAASHHLGEVSIKLAENLGGKDVNPRTGSGMPEGPFAYVIFPGSQSSPPWPRSEADIQATADAELAKIGGWDAVLACLK